MQMPDIRLLWEEKWPAIIAWFERTMWGWITFGLGVVPVYLLASQDNPFITVGMQLGQVGTAILSGFVGAVAGATIILVLYLLRRYPPIGAALLALTALYAMLLPLLGQTMPAVTGFIGFFVGLLVAAAWAFPSKRRRPTSFGSAEWADVDHLRKAGVLAPPSRDGVPPRVTEGEGFILGRFPLPAARRGEPPPAPGLLRYTGDRHLLTVAPTRAGKGVGTIIPNLLTYRGSCLVIDPKGENALRTAGARAAMGQHIFVVDPWRIADTAMLGAAPARYNPLDALRPDDPDVAEDAMLLADALVLSRGDDKNQFWNEEAKAFLAGLILYVATDAEEKDTRHLGRVRDLLNLNKEDLHTLLDRMSTSGHPAVKAAGARAMGKDSELLAGVLTSVQSHTHFLDSPRIRESLSMSDFRFEDLKRTPMTIYLILPADRLSTFGRWLRLLIGQALTVNARNIDVKPERPVLFMLDEMATLGHLEAVEQAFGLMAGYGMQLWGIVQDLSQLERVYGRGWQTFIANAGVLQYLGSRDKMTAEYFSKLCGVMTITVWSISSAISRAVGGNSSSTTHSQSETQRPLAFPDELMTIDRSQQLVLVENWNPILGEKIAYFNDPELARLASMAVPTLVRMQTRMATRTPPTPTPARTSSPAPTPPPVEMAMPAPVRTPTPMATRTPPTPTPARTSAPVPMPPPVARAEVKPEFKTAEAQAQVATMSFGPIPKRMKAKPRPGDKGR